MSHYSLCCQSGSYGLTGAPSGYILEGPPESPDSRRLVRMWPDDALVDSAVDARGRSQVRLSGPLQLGRAAESEVLGIFAEALRARGHSIEVRPGKDDRGVDRRVVIDGDESDVQIVTVPAESHRWNTLRDSGEASWTDSEESLVGDVRHAVVKKSVRVGGMILLLDGRGLGAAIGPRLITAYLDRFRPPAREYGIKEVWIVGPTSRSVFPLAPLVGGLQGDRHP